MNDYWKNETRHYPVSLKIKHFEASCALNKASSSVEFGFGGLVQELIRISYEKNLSSDTTKAFSYFCYEIFIRSFDYPKDDPLLFDYKEIQDAFRELQEYKIHEGDDYVYEPYKYIEESTISKIVALLDLHYYCPYGTQATLGQHLKLAGFSKTRQKALLKEKKVVIHGSNSAVDLKTIVNEQDQVMVDQKGIPRYCKNKIEVEKWESW